MAIKKKLRGLADPLLEEVVCGLEETLKSSKKNAPVTGASSERSFSGDPLLRDVEKYHQGKRTKRPSLATKIAIEESLLLKRHKKGSLFAGHLEGIYDPILHEYVIPHQALARLRAFEDDMEKKQVLFKEMSERRRKLESLDRLLKHTKRGSLQRKEAFYNPTLQEYVVPKETSIMTHAFEQDKENKRLLFKEMSVRKRNNLYEREVFCDPIVHVYRANDIEEIDN